MDERQERDAALARERKSQLRGLLWLAAAALGWVLWRGRELHLFHSSWWRF